MVVGSKGGDESQVTDFDSFDTTGPASRALALNFTDL
jgi:hypothetical protein